jgi:hypothetical protein
MWQGQSGQVLPCFINAPVTRKEENRNEFDWEIGKVKGNIEQVKGRVSHMEYYYLLRRYAV